MMKKLVLGLVALLMVFAISCSSAYETAWLDAVKGKSLYGSSAAITSVGEFSEDGKTLTLLGIENTFVSATSATEAEYSYNLVITINRTLTLDGDQLTISGTEYTLK